MKPHTYFLKDSHINHKLLTSLCNIINEAYDKGEKGMWKDNTVRTTLEDLSNYIKEERLLVASTNDTLVGCVLVKAMDDGFTGEFGMLAVDKNYKQQGIGLQLVEAAEDWAKAKGFTHMRLEILSPTDWKHPMKEILKKWYSKLGYEPILNEPFNQMYPELTQQLKTECNFTIWLKSL